MKELEIYDIINLIMNEGVVEVKKPRDIKTEAKKIYSPYYIYCLIIVMIYSAVIGLQGFLTTGGIIAYKMTANQMIMQTLMILSAVAGFFIAIPMEVGVKTFFLNLTRSEAEMSDILAPFKKAYDRAVIIVFLRNVKILLWSVLLIIPGIYKAYEYAMLPYILAEEPNIQTKDAFERSKKMMTGNRMNLFKLQLSFVGWYIVALIPLGAGLIFLAPYTNTAYAMFYEEIKENTK